MQLASLSFSLACCINENLASHGARHFSNKYEIQYPCDSRRANATAASVSVTAAAVERIDTDPYRTS